MKMKKRIQRLKARQKSYDETIRSLSGTKRVNGYNKPGSLNK